MTNDPDFELTERRRIRHDLRSVLGAALGYADLMTEAISEADRIRFAMRVVETLERLDDRIGSLLADDPNGVTVDDQSGHPGAPGPAS